MTYSPRTDAGIRIPRKGTTARKIYELWLRKLSPYQIAAHLRVSQETVRVTIWRFRNPDKANRTAKAAYRAARQGQP